MVRALASSPPSNSGTLIVVGDYTDRPSSLCLISRWNAKDDAVSVPDAPSKDWSTGDVRAGIHVARAV